MGDQSRERMRPDRGMEAFGAILAGFVAFLIFGGLAAGLTWYAVQRLKRDL